VELPIDKVSFIVATFELKPALASLLALYEVAGKLDPIVVP
jgi:hypothetical protein